MEKNDSDFQADSEPAAGELEFDVSVFDTRAHFETWLDTLKRRHAVCPELQFQENQHSAAFFLECSEGTDCEITFEGLLRVDGYLSGTVRSEEGILLTSTHARVNADIEVRVALIDCAVKGNITATERVVLRSTATVAGNINTPALSIEHGALVEGDCAFESMGSQVAAENEGPAQGQIVDEFLVASPAGV